MSGDLLRRVLDLLAQDRPPGVGVIVSGGVGAGKTKAGEVLVDDLRVAGVDVGGVLAPRVVDAGRTVGYDVLDVVTDERRTFARSGPPGTPVGRYYVRDSGVRFARRVLDRDKDVAEVVVLDEVGALELQGAGHCRALSSLLASRSLPVIMVRSTFVDSLTRRFKLEPSVWQVTPPPSASDGIGASVDLEGH